MEVQSPDGPLTLERAERAPTCARRFFTENFGAALTRRTFEDSQLIISELVTNVVTHGTGVITLCVAMQGDALLIEVTDELANRGPALRQSSADEPGGRGLQLVSAVASSWGWSPDSTCKVVWAHVAL